MNSGNKFSATCAFQDFEPVILTSCDIPDAELDEPFCKHTVVLPRNNSIHIMEEKLYVALLHFFHLFNEYGVE